jgi:hypothetical protein
MILSPSNRLHYVSMLETYPQTQGFLRRNEGYDPLGLLCELHSQLTQTPWQFDQASQTFSYIDCYKVLPEAVREYFRLFDHNPTIVYKGNILTLTDLNDIHRLTLKDIAQLIKP